MRLTIRKSVLLLAFAAACFAAGDDGYKFISDHPGGASIDVTTSNFARFGLKPAESAAFKANLQGLHDLLLAQPVFHPLLGIEVQGYIGAHHGGQVMRTAPARGYGFIVYFPYVMLSDSKRPFKMEASPWQMEIFINSPGEGLIAAGFSDPDRQLTLYWEPKPVGRLNGYPLYRDKDDNEFVVLSSTGKPPWIPATREDYVRICIKDIEKELAQFKKEQSEIDPNLLAQLSPEDRATVEKAMGDSGAISLIRQRLKRHQEALAAMSPRERAAQAQNGDPGNGDYLGPQLAPLGKEGIGPGYVKPNPDFFDPSRARSDLQLIVVKIEHGGLVDVNHPGPAKSGNPAGLRLWETLHNSDWKAISGILPK